MNRSLFTEDKDNGEQASQNRCFLKNCPEKVAALFRYWDTARGDAPMPRRSSIRPEDITGHLPGVLLVDVEGVDEHSVGVFRYRVVGTAEVALRDHDPTGKLVQDGFFGPSKEDVLACYESVRRQRTFLYDPLEYTTPAGKWRDEHSLFLPLSEDGQTVSQILVYSERRRHER